MVILIAGYPYAGRSILLQQLESMKYISRDDMPPLSVPEFIRAHGGGTAEKIAITVRTETGADAEDLRRLTAELRGSQIPFKLVFVEAGDTLLLDRNAKDGRIGETDMTALLDRLRRDLEPVRGEADLIINSNYVTPEEERNRVINLAEGRSPGESTTVEIMSFGFRYGPASGDLIMDVRFIPNPYYISSLRPLTGKDKACADYVFGFESSRETLRALTELCTIMAKAFSDQGRSSIAVRIGCTGGQHRSVAITEALAANLRSRNIPVAVLHRELD
ncbi:RNase adapter RapZ [Breznakiella homolactica]|uniref:Nucleotide-binding protein n=1 Tax=Breznakiella homolactica TaxID=2798577 RepID=A0A7T8B9T0_9SPIR|nr:RNase adapter RapZ [Breznakiella homolactica]QQO08631.1 hypothetical protein JFL75_17120 [Breznakiella homolactica]